MRRMAPGRIMLPEVRRMISTFLKNLTNGPDHVWKPRLDLQGRPVYRAHAAYTGVMWIAIGCMPLSIFIWDYTTGGNFWRELYSFNRTHAFDPFPKLMGVAVLINFGLGIACLFKRTLIVIDHRGHSLEVSDRRLFRQTGRRFDFNDVRLVLRPCCIHSRVNWRGYLLTIEADKLRFPLAKMKDHKAINAAAANAHRETRLELEEESKCLDLSGGWLLISGGYEF